MVCQISDPCDVPLRFTGAEEHDDVGGGRRRRGRCQLQLLWWRRSFIEVGCGCGCGCGGGGGGGGSGDGDGDADGGLIL
ncbi:hypothetical protein QVD17_07276 [Tagetes erecta]|uniref:Uncharacterized protein n=1 Tax=Tagetes erecta TaxID=13708 RepID=A0AAD8PCS0_TARER|nr:hypothetical protein QVD17_07276 [Tagetes erecta]